MFKPLLIAGLLSLGLEPLPASAVPSTMPLTAIAPMPLPGGGGGPANDLCSAVTAEALTIGSTLTFTGDNTLATFTGDAVEGNLLQQYPFPDTWHAFTTTGCADVTVSYCATDSGWSNVWKLLTTDCPADNLVYPSAQDQTTCTNGNWTFSFNALPAGTYYLPVPNVGFGQGGGAYAIDVSAVACSNLPPANDLCSAVTPEALGIGDTLEFVGDNTNATFAGDAVEGNLLQQYPFPDTWHAFTTTACTDLTVSYCATDSGWSNVWKLLTTDCPADSLINPSVQEQTTCANGNWTFRFYSLAAGTYYLPVPNVGFGQGGGAYNVAVSAAACANGVPDNDLCQDITAQDLPVGGTITFAGNNTNATFAGDAEEGNLLDQYPSPNTWHAFTTTGCATVTVSYCATDSGWSNVWKLITMQCPADTLIPATSQDTTHCTNGNWTFSFYHLEAGTYYLPVPNVGFGQGGGIYSIEVSAADCSVSVPEAAIVSTDWTVHPNPTTGELTIATPNLTGTVVLDLLDMTGRKVWSEQRQLGSGGLVHLDLGGQAAPGTYLLQLTTANGRSAQRLVVK